MDNIAVLLIRTMPDFRLPGKRCEWFFKDTYWRAGQKGGHKKDAHPARGARLRPKK